MPVPDQLPFDEAGDLGLDLRRWLEIALRRCPLVAAFGAVGLGVGLAIYTALPRRWEAEAVLQIERQSPLPGTGTETFWSQPWWDAEYYPTRNELLASRGLAERVVVALDLSADPAFNPEGPFLADAGSDAARREVIGVLANRVLEGLEIVPVDQTRLVRIVHRSSSPELSARIASAIATEFIEWEVENRRRVGSRVSTYLADQIGRLEEDVRQREAELTRRREAGAGVLLPLGEDEALLLQHLQKIQQELLAAEAAAVLAERDARAPPSADATSSVAGPPDPIEAELLALERRYERDLTHFRPDWPAMRELREEIERLREQSAAHRAEAAREEHREVVRRAAEARERVAGLELEIRRIRERIRAVGSLGLETGGLEIELRTRRQLLDRLLQLRAETDLQALLDSTTEAEIRVVNEALVPRTPYEPVLRRWILGGTGVGLLLALAVVAVLELTDRRVRSAEEAEEILGLPVLGVVPDLATGIGQRYVARRPLDVRFGSTDRKQRWRLVENRVRKEELRVELLPIHRPRHAVSEAYRTLGGTLLQLAPGRSAIAVTSAQPHEGKTSTVVNLGAVLSQLGRHVVLVDCDLRRPRLGSVFELESEQGLAQVLLGECEPEHAILDTAIPRLRVLPSGRLPDEPWRLLASARFDSLVAALRDEADVVLLDTPPLLAVTDPSLVGPRVDGVVICLEADRITRDELRACAERLGLVTSNLLGTILNRFVPTLGGGYGSYSTYYSEWQASEDDERHRSA